MVGRQISPELRHACITDVMKVVVRDLIVFISQTSGASRGLADGLRQSSMYSIENAQVNEQDHLAQVRQAMKDFHQEFFAELDQAFASVEAQRKRSE